MRGIGRRQLLQGVIALAGVALSSEVLAEGVFSGERSLSSATMSLVTAVAGTLIPATDTPGAVEAGVPEMFSKLLANWASPAQREGLAGALLAIDARAVAATGSAFVALPTDQRYEVLSAADKALASDPAYGRLKDLLVTLYYLSEAGATVELRYEHSPGAWEPSLPVTAETRNPGGPGL